MFATRPRDLQVFVGSRYILVSRAQTSERLPVGANKAVEFVFAGLSSWQMLVSVSCRAGDVDSRAPAFPILLLPASSHTRLHT